MSEKRDFPILNGKLLSDLDANGHKIIGIDIEVPPEKIKEAVAPELEAKADATALETEVSRAKGAEAALAGRVTELEENAGGSSVEVVAPSPDGEGKAADAKAVYDELEKKQNKLKQGENITIAADGTISASGGDVDVVAKIAGKEIEPSSVVVKGENSTIEMNDAYPFNYEKNSDTVVKEVNIDMSLSNLGINLHSSETGWHSGSARFGCEGFNVSRQNGANNTSHSFDLDVKIGKVTYEGSDAPSAIENTIANVVNAMPRYRFVDAEIADGVVTVAPYTNAKIVSDGTVFTVAVGEGSGYMRDCVLRVECGETAPKITWGTNFHPRTDAETDFACEAGVRNVFWITEHSPNEFCVAGWQETEGGGE